MSLVDLAEPETAFGVRWQAKRDGAFASTGYALSGYSIPRGLCHAAQGSSCLATLGVATESRRDSSLAEPGLEIPTRIWRSVGAGQMHERPLAIPDY